LLLCSVLSSSVSSLALAAEPSLSEWAVRRVDEALVQPLVRRESEGSKFSRSRPVPRERRARVPSGEASSDARGRAFVTFAVDVRFGGGEWQEDVVGCVYRQTGHLYVKVGDAYRPAAFLLGKNVDPVAGVCEAGPKARS
jgi:hypothetical protein